MTTSLASKTVTFSTPLPRALDTQIHVRLTARDKSLMLFITTAGTDDGELLVPMGSFVYAVPNRFNSSEPLCTNIYIEENSLELAVRLAQLVVKRTRLPVYVFSSLSLDRMGLGGTVEEVLEAFQAVTKPLLPLLPRPLQNGV
ncbi:hypothetical protein SEPCBS57363_006235 [Sporothrix epigloea]|uniref:Proteasome assembly chaperone 3 n=1 Tax=Sporothrix epigloea TaxID=1892477 RepID=A0ABP0E5E0_9PEZI